MAQAIVSDIHGNLEALKTVLADIEKRQVDQIYCLGDIIGYGPDPRECVDLCRDFELCILGNHDQGALFDPEGFSSNAERAIFWTRSQLEDGEDGKNPERLKFLSEVPRTFREGRMMFVHGSARSPLNEYVFPEDIYNARKIEKIFSLVDGQCFQGHTHVPGVFTEDCRFFSPSELDDRYEFGEMKVMINVGSVGQPRDNDPRSSYVILDDNSVEFVRIEYPVEETVQKIYSIPELDNFLGDRLKDGR